MVVVLLRKPALCKEACHTFNRGYILVQHPRKLKVNLWEYILGLYTDYSTPSRLKITYSTTRDIYRYMRILVIVFGVVGLGVSQRPIT